MNNIFSHTDNPTQISFKRMTSNEKPKGGDYVDIFKADMSKVVFKPWTVVPGNVGGSASNCTYGPDNKYLMLNVKDMCLLFGLKRQWDEKKGKWSDDVSAPIGIRGVIRDPDTYELVFPENASDHVKGVYKRFEELQAVADEWVKENPAPTELIERNFDNSHPVSIVRSSRGYKKDPSKKENQIIKLKLSMALPKTKGALPKPWTDFRHVDKDLKINDQYRFSHIEKRSKELTGDLFICITRIYHGDRGYTIQGRVNRVTFNQFGTDPDEKGGSVNITNPELAGYTAEEVELMNSKPNVCEDESDDEAPPPPGKGGENSASRPKKGNRVLADSDDEDEAPRKRKKRPVAHSDSEEEAPRKKKKKKQQQRRSGSDDDDDEEDEPVQKPKKKQKTPSSFDEPLYETY